MPASRGRTSSAPGCRTDVGDLDGPKARRGRYPGDRALQSASRKEPTRDASYAQTCEYRRGPDQEFRRGVHVMHGNEAVISVLAWRTLSEQERDWLSTCFYVVGLGVAAADGENLARSSSSSRDLSQRSREGRGRTCSPRLQRGSCGSSGLRTSSSRKCLCHPRKVLAASRKRWEALVRSSPSSPRTTVTNSVPHCWWPASP